MEVARNPSSSPEEIVNVSNYLIHKGFNLVAGGVVAYRGFSKETRQKILVFSQLKFDEFFDKALGVLKGSPEQEKQFIEVYHKASEGLLLELFSKIVSTNVWSEINPPKGQTALLDGDLQKLAKEMEKVIRDEHKREAST